MDINIEKMTDEAASRGRDSISILLFSCRRPDRFSQSHLSAGRPTARSRAATCEPTADANDKMNQARNNNDWDISNDGIQSAVGSLPVRAPQRKNIRPTEGSDWTHGVATMVYNLMVYNPGCNLTPGWPGNLQPNWSDLHVLLKLLIILYDFTLRNKF